MRNRFDVYGINRVIDLTKLQLLAKGYSEDLLESLPSEELVSMVGKSVEEMIEFGDELWDRHMLSGTNDKLIEEAYDSLNSTASVYAFLFDDIKEVFNSETSGIVYRFHDTPILLNDIRLMNSYMHMDSNYQSKTGLTSKNLKNFMIRIIHNFIVTLESFEEDVLIQELVIRKLDKWESKL